ncbi:putative metal ion resistance protein/transporter [Xylogone sp. PMI_703]|nr:putative metal ion resistance protein/transporter [Xylogone sp. PMI_703]
MTFRISRSSRLIIIIGISFSFFVAEISVGFYTHSLALVADAFHYMNDLVGFIVALVALKMSQLPDSPKDLSFGWQRAQLLGAFFNGVFLLALGVSIFLQSIERFVTLQRVESPKLILIMGAVGFALNIISILFLHGMHRGEIINTGTYFTLEHDHRSGEAGNAIELPQLVNTSHHHSDHRHKITPSKHRGHDLGIMGVLVHIIGDAINNICVIIAALIIWRTRHEGRFYADPAVSMVTAILILLSAVPLVKNSGLILLQSVPLGVDLDDVKHDLEKIPGVTSVHELHAWRLSQDKALASAHLITSDPSLESFMDKAQLINECLHAYGIHSATVQPELVSTARRDTGTEPRPLRQRPGKSSGCRINCGSLCEDLTCCG